MYIYNGFSQTPTRNFTAAGIDFFVPNIKDDDSRAIIAIEALKKSYKITDEDIENISKIISAERSVAVHTNNITNVIHLYYAYKSKTLIDIRKYQGENEAIKYFLNNVLTFDDSYTPGVKCGFSDMLLINSGIKVALESHTCLEYVNKSGKGNKGWSVKACLVDEDYSGYCHLSMQYLWYDENDGTVYCGDKLTQGVIYTTLTDNAIELTAEEYDEKMKSSKRGADAFGSSDVKH